MNCCSNRLELIFYIIFNNNASDLMTNFFFHLKIYFIIVQLEITQICLLISLNQIKIFFPPQPYGTCNSSFVWKFWLLRPPFPFEFPITLLGVSMDIICNCTSRELSIHKVYTVNLRIFITQTNIVEWLFCKQLFRISNRIIWMISLIINFIKINIHVLDMSLCSKSEEWRSFNNFGRSMFAGLVNWKSFALPSLNNNKI